MKFLLNKISVLIGLLSTITLFSQIYNRPCQENEEAIISNVSQVAVCYNPTTNTIVSRTSSGAEIGSKYIPKDFKNITQKTSFFVSLFSETAQEILVFDIFLNEKYRIKIPQELGYIQVVLVQNTTKILLYSANEHRVYIYDALNKKIIQSKLLPRKNYPIIKMQLEKGKIVITDSALNKIII